MQPPDWREGYKLTGADLDGALDDAAAATTGIDRDQLADDARFDLLQFAEQGAFAGLSFVLERTSAGGYNLVQLRLPRGGGRVLGTNVNDPLSVNLFFLQNGAVVATPFDVAETDEVFVVIYDTLIDVRGTVSAKWRQQR